MESMMTNSTLYQSDIEPVQRCIGELLERIIVDYQQTKEERRRSPSLCAQMLYLSARMRLQFWRNWS